MPARGRPPLRREDLGTGARPGRHRPGVPAAAALAPQGGATAAASPRRGWPSGSSRRGTGSGTGCRGTPWRTNGEVPGPYLRRGLPLPHGAQLAWDALDRGRLSARGVDKVFRLAWTVADLAGRDRPSRDDTALALAMRRGEQPGTLAREVG